MPTVLTNPKCSTLGCVNTKAKYSTLCVEHGGRDVFDYKRYNNGKRKQSTAKYNTSQWHTLRQIQLSQYPLCASCSTIGIVTAAKHVDHIFPWAQIGEQAFTHNLYQSLCGGCHSVKTQLEQSGVYRRYGTPTIDYTQADYKKAMADAHR